MILGKLFLEGEIKY